MCGYLSCLLLSVHLWDRRIMKLHFYCDNRRRKLLKMRQICQSVTCSFTLYVCFRSGGFQILECSCCNKLTPTCNYLFLFSRLFFFHTNYQMEVYPFLVCPVLLCAFLMGKKRYFLLWKTRRQKERKKFLWENRSMCVSVKYRLAVC